MTGEQISDEPVATTAIPAQAPAGEDAFEEFDLDDIEVIESKVFG